MTFPVRHNKFAASQAATLIEVVISIGLVAVMVVSLYTGVSSAFGMVNLARENLRATQIALEKMETMRMYSWEQVNSNGFIPRTFTAPFFPYVGQDETNNGGLTYYGTTILTNADVPLSYSNSMKLVIVTINWTNRNIPQSREMRTFISQYGMQRYIY